MKICPECNKPLSKGMRSDAIRHGPCKIKYHNRIKKERKGKLKIDRSVKSEKSFSKWLLKNDSKIFDELKWITKKLLKDFKINSIDIKTPLSIYRSRGHSFSNAHYKYLKIHLLIKHPELKKHIKSERKHYDK